MKKPRTPFEFPSRFFPTGTGLQLFFEIFAVFWRCFSICHFLPSFLFSLSPILPHLSYFLVYIQTASDIHRKQKVNSGFFPLFAADKLDNIVRRTIQNFTEPFHGIYRNSPIMLQIVDCSGINLVLRYQEICGDFLFFHSLP